MSRLERLSRISTMTPEEISHRLLEKARAELERIGLAADSHSLPEDLAFKDYLDNEAASRFYFSDPRRLTGFIREHFPHWIDRAIGEAELLCQHRFELLGYPPVVLGSEIDWHRDPLTGRVWEKRFWADYRLTAPCPAGDPKTIHELNRHQHLPRLAKAYLLTGNERYAAEALAQMESWIEQNPPGVGINWHSSLEIALRAISWLWTIFLLQPSRSLNAAAARRIGDSLFAQLEHVYRYTSVFSSPNTHLLGEAAALFISGLVFRDFKRPAVWLEAGAALLLREIDKQVLADGVHGELSSYYHCYALDFYLQALILAERNRFDFPERVRARVGAMLQFLADLTRPDGAIPLLGDDDGGRALALQRRDYRSFQDALCHGAVLFLREDLKYQAGDFFEETFWLLGEQAWDIFRLLGSEPPSRTEGFQPDAGYWIRRSGWGPRDSHLIFDCGGLGMLTGGHSHADALSIVLFGGGRELLVDPGTFIYNGAPEWRDYFRSSRAHNTVAVDGRDQADEAGTFRWKTKFGTRVTQRLLLPDFDYVEAEHDGYARLPCSVVHRRRLLYVKPEYWVVVDDFRGAGEHSFELHFHFGPDVRISDLRNDQNELVMRAPEAGLLVGLHTSGRAQAELIRGWRSHGYGEKTPIPALRASWTGAVPTAAVTLLAGLPAETAPQFSALQVADDKTIACAFTHNHLTDTVIFSAGGSDVTVGEFQGRGEFFWLRTDGDRLQQIFAIRALSLSYRGELMFERTEPGPYFNAGGAGSEQEPLCAQFVES